MKEPQLLNRQKEGTKYRILTWDLWKLRFQTHIWVKFGTHFMDLQDLRILRGPKMENRSPPGPQLCYLFQAGIPKIGLLGQINGVLASRETKIRSPRGEICLGDPKFGHFGQIWGPWSRIWASQTLDRGSPTPNLGSQRPNFGSKLANQAILASWGPPFWPLGGQNDPKSVLREVKNWPFYPIFLISVEWEKLPSLLFWTTYFRPPKGLKSKKEPPPFPLLSDEPQKLLKKWRKISDFLSFFGPRARNIHIPVARREGPLQGPHQKWSKRAQKWPKIDPFEGVESLPNPIARALFGVEGRPVRVVPNRGSKNGQKGPPRPQIEGPRPSIEDLPTPRPQKWPFLGPSEGVFLPPKGETCRLLGLHFEGPFK